MQAPKNRALSVNQRQVARSPLKYNVEQPETTVNRYKPSQRSHQLGESLVLAGSEVSFQLPGGSPLDSMTQSLRVSRLANNNAWGERPQTAPAASRSRKGQSAASRRLSSGLGFSQSDAEPLRPQSAVVGRHLSAGSLGRPQSAPPPKHIAGPVQQQRKQRQQQRRGSSVRQSSGPVGRVVQRPWGLQEGHGGGNIAPQIFSKLEQLEVAARKRDSARRLEICRELFDMVIQHDAVHGAILQRIKHEYEDQPTAAVPQAQHMQEGGQHTLSENYSHLGGEYRKLMAKLRDTHSDYTILQEQYEILLRQQQRLALLREQDAKKLEAQAARIEELQAQPEEGAPNMQHLHALERLVQELATELDAARQTERTAVTELVDLRQLLVNGGAHLPPTLADAAGGTPTEVPSTDEAELRSPMTETSSTLSEDGAFACPRPTPARPGNVPALDVALAVQHQEEDLLALEARELMASRLVAEAPEPEPGPASAPELELATEPDALLT
jgi:hypothetical protein